MRATDHKTIQLDTFGIPARQKAALMRAAVEALESRMLLSTVVVNSVLDTLFPIGSPSISLRNAVAIANAANEPTTIKFDSTVFATKKTITLGGTQLELSNTRQPTTIQGPGAKLLLVSGNAKSRVLKIDTGVTASVSGVTITHGDVFSAVTGSEPSIDAAGGGISNAGVLTLTGTTVSNNRAGNYGGSGIANFGTVTIRNTTISGNGLKTSNPELEDVGNGGGIYNLGLATLTNVTVAGNRVGAHGSGGGIFTAHNSVGLGLSQVTISNNTATGGDGGVYSGGGGLTIEAIIGAEPMATRPTIANSLIAGNHLWASAGNPDEVATDVSAHPLMEGASLVSRGFNLIGKVDGSNGWKSTDLFGSIYRPLNANLGTLTDNGGPTWTMMPLAGSPALDHGSNALIPTGTPTDQRGYGRIIHGTVDIGAVERQATIVRPASPTELVAAATPQRSIQLTWKDNAANEDRFTIEYAKSADGPWSVFTTVRSNLNTYNAGGLQAGVTYSFRVSAGNARGTSGFSNIASAKTFGISIAGTLDTSFGVKGIVSGYGGSDFVFMADGSFYSGVAHYSAKGQLLGLIRPVPVQPALDQVEPGVTGIPAGSFFLNDYVITPDGQAIGIGSVEIVVPDIDNPGHTNRVSRAVIERFNPNGAIDSTFGLRGVVVLHGESGKPSGTDYLPTGVVVGPDGKPVVSVFSEFHSATGWLNAGTLWRLPADGKGESEILIHGFFDSVAVGSDGTVCAIDTALEVSAAGVGHLNNDIHTFGPRGHFSSPLPFSTSRAVAVVMPDGKVVVAGGQADVPYVARYTPDLRLDETFGNQGVLRLDFIPRFELGRVAVQSDHKILITGANWETEMLIRFDEAGNVDRTFGKAGYVFPKVLGEPAGDPAAAIAPDGAIFYLGNRFMRFFGDAGSISGTLFEDKNGNGKRDAGEPVLVSSMIYLDKNNNSVMDPGETATLTNAAGSYTFVLPAGQYRLRKYLRPGYQTTQPAATYYDIALNSGQIVTGKNFGHRLIPKTIGVFSSMESISTQQLIDDLI